MVADALASDRLIGMVLLRPGWEADYDGRPPVYPIGCSGVITHVERCPTAATTSSCAASSGSGSSGRRVRSYRRGLVEWLRRRRLASTTAVLMHACAAASRL